MKLRALICVAAGLAAAAALTVTAGAAKLPDRYDLREVKGALSEIRNQGRIGSCWTFAANANAETWLRLNGFGEYDFSERHMELLLARYYADFENTETGIYNNKIGNGGCSGRAIQYYFSGFGLVNEEDFPYKPTELEAYTPDLQRSCQVKTAGVMVKDVDIFESADNEYDVAFTAQDKINQLKLDIYANGAIPVSYFASTADFYGVDGVSYLESGAEDSNHAVALIGWDDNYPKENFFSEDGYTAGGDGAFIVRNSWGDSVYDEGYFYLSYYCPTLLSSDYPTITRMDYIDYDNIYTTPAYIGVVWQSSECGDTNEEYIYRYFEKTDNEQAINEVTLLLRGSSSYEVYITPDCESAPNERQLVASGAVDRTCFKTIEFDPVKLSGEYFAVMVKLSSSDPSLSLLPMTNIYDSAEAVKYPDSLNGMCYVSTDGDNWTDTLEKFDNRTVFMRAYTVNTAETHTLSFSSEYNSEVVTLVSESGRNMPRNPDGGYTVDNGTYTYSAEALGFETISGTVTISGKDKKVKLSLKKCPELIDGNDYYGILDKEETFEISLDYGYVGESLEPIKKVTANGKKVSFTVEEDTLIIDRAGITGIKSGDTLTTKVFYENGAVAELQTPVLNYSSGYRLTLAANRLTKELQAIMPNNSITEEYLDELIGGFIGKYGTKMEYYIYCLSFDPSNGKHDGSYSYMITLYYDGWQQVINYAETFSARDNEPTLKSLSGWDAIIASKTLEKAMTNGTTVEINLPESGIVPEKFWKKVMGSKAILQLNTSVGDIWRIDCQNVKTASDMDLTVYSGVGLSCYSTYNYQDAEVDEQFHIDDSMTVPADLTINLYDALELTGKTFEYVDIIKINPIDSVDFDFGCVIYRLGNLTLNGISGGSYGVLRTDHNAHVFGDLDNEGARPDEADYKTLKQRITDGYYNGMDSRDPELVKADGNEDGIIDKNDLTAFKEYLNEIEAKKHNSLIA